MMSIGLFFVAFLLLSSLEKVTRTTFFMFVVFRPDPIYIKDDSSTCWPVISNHDSMSGMGSPVPGQSLGKESISVGERAGDQKEVQYHKHTSCTHVGEQSCSLDSPQQDEAFEDIEGGFWHWSEHEHRKEQRPEHMTNHHKHRVPCAWI